LSYRAIRSANRSCTGLSPIPAACVASNALVELKYRTRICGVPQRRPLGLPGRKMEHAAGLPLRRLCSYRSAFGFMRCRARHSHRVRAGLQAAASTISASRAL